MTTGTINLLLDELVTAVESALATRGRPAPVDTWHYHGAGAPGPLACCTVEAGEDDFGQDGSLFVHWSREFRSLRFPSPRSGGDDAIPAGRATVDIWARLWRCWPKRDADGFDFAAADAAAQGLADDAECIEATLVAAICSGAFENVTGCAQVVLEPIVPIRPAGGCAGVEVHLIASILPVVSP